MSGESQGVLGGAEGVAKGSGLFQGSGVLYGGTV